MGAHFSLRHLYYQILDTEGDVYKQILGIQASFSKLRKLRYGDEELDQRRGTTCGRSRISALSIFTIKNLDTEGDVYKEKPDMSQRASPSQGHFR